MSNFFEHYQLLRKQVDDSSRALESQHKEQMNCKAGCDLCCESISVFPIEFDAIKNELGDLPLPKKKLKHRLTSKCRFLSEHKCLIYKVRPIICRTQGLPLLYENFDGTGHELSVCKLNFKRVQPNSFNINNALFMPPINSQLFLLNKDYIEQLYDKKLTPQKRIKLNWL